MRDYSKVGTKALTYRLVKAFGIVIFTSLLFFPLVYVLTNSLILTLIFWLILEGVLVVVPLYLSYVNLGYQIDTQSLNLREGILNISRTNIPFAKITNANIYQSLIQRLFSVGNVTIDQEDSTTTWRSVDLGDLNKIAEAVSSKSNIQPFSKSN